MALDIPILTGYLKKIHLFRGMPDEQLIAVAEALNDEKWVEPGEIIVREGREGDDLFLIYSGRVEVTRRGKGGKTRMLATLVAGDYFGEEALLKHIHRTATVTATERSLLLVLSRAAFNEISKLAPKLRANLEVSISSRKLARRSYFKWLQEGEVIYFLARKHPIQLLKALIGPIVALLAALALFIYYLLFPSDAMLAVSGLGLLITLGWFGWNYVDWSNDYYIVTNRRVIWLEKVVALYDSRQEAPLSTVLSVGVETSQVGRILDYGDVIVRTFVGKILFNEVQRPYQAAMLIEEHWSRTREASRKSDVEAMQKAIKEKIGLIPVSDTPAGSSQSQAPSREPNRLQFFLANLIKVRFEEIGGVITYRKHPFVLFLQTWKPGVVLIASIALLVWRLSNLPVKAAGTPSSGIDALVAVFIFLGLVSSVWYVYQYLDWTNDRFQVTQDQIFDIDKTPLGRETRKAASLDNILSTEYQRIGILKVILNYGDVIITVGGAQMVFEDVANPPLVQQDIDQRRTARLDRKKQAEAQAERERMSDWIATYHRSMEEFRRGQEEETAPPEPDVTLEEEDESGVQ